MTDDSTKTEAIAHLKEQIAQLQENAEHSLAELSEVQIRKIAQIVEMLDTAFIGGESESEIDRLWAAGYEWRPGKMEEKAELPMLVEYFMDKAKGDRNRLARFLGLLPLLWPAQFEQCSAEEIKQAVLGTRGNAREIGISVALGRLSRSLPTSDDDYKKAVASRDKQG